MCEARTSLRGAPHSASLIGELRFAENKVLAATGA